MAASVVAYDRELPEIPDRRPWLPPDCHLVRDAGAAGGWRIAEGRRLSDLMLIAGLRRRVDQWRDEGYPGASDVTRRLFTFWFDEDHDVAGFGSVFRYYFCQREAIESVAYLVDVAGIRDTAALIQHCARVNPHGLLRQSDEVIIETLVDGQRRVRRHDPELGGDRVQDLPPEGLRRYAFKMATGSGKTWVMAMLIVWSYFHKRLVPDSPLSDNFAVVAPNVIVYQRLERDFESARIFREIPLIPPEWNDAFDLKVILRGEATEPARAGNLFVANIQHLYERTSVDDWTPANAVEALLGRRPAKDIANSRRPMLDRLKSLPHLVVLNDEAHHVHDEELAWNRSLVGVHKALPAGLAMWLDFSATPKDQAGLYFPWIIVDYPLAQAVEDRIVKAPLIVSRESDPLLPRRDPETVTKANAIEKYAFWIHAAVQRRREHAEVYEPLGIRPILFITAEKSAIADVIGEHLRHPEFGFEPDEVLVIHTDTKGEITKGDLESARQAARDVDRRESPVKVIVSVMMLKEGWDVRNVTVVLGLRPFSAKAEILPEQVIGRGLRIIPGVGPDRTQTLEVLGTSNLLDFLRERLEAEGVGFGEADRTPPPLPVRIYPVKAKLAHDIAIPRTNATLVRNYRRLDQLDPMTIEPLLEQADLGRSLTERLRVVFATTLSFIAEMPADYDPYRIAQDALSAITEKTRERAGLTADFPEIYRIVREYVTKRCFGREVDVDTVAIRAHLFDHEIQEGIAAHLAAHIGRLTVEQVPTVIEGEPVRLSKVAEFHWRRDLPPIEASKTIFNYVATYNRFERDFAVFLEGAPDVLHFASLSTTEQGDSWVQFSVNYIKPSGAIGRYYPDFVAVQETPDELVNWIIETKGRVYPGTEHKDAALEDWCQRVSAEVGAQWRFIRINQVDFQRSKPSTLAELVYPDSRLPRLDLASDDDQAGPAPEVEVVSKDVAPRDAQPVVTEDESGIGPSIADGSASAEQSPLSRAATDEMMALIRQVFGDGSDQTLDGAITAIVASLPPEIATDAAAAAARSALHTAVQRDILDAQGKRLRLTAKTIEQFSRDALKDQFVAALPIDQWIEREDAIRDFARWLGFRRTGATIRDTAKSVINGLLRERRLERDGGRIRRVLPTA